MEQQGAQEFAGERRQNVVVREVFVQAYTLLEPFFSPENAWAGQSHEHLAFRALHEQFPQLSPNEVLILVTAAKRVFSEGGKPTSI